jgi:cardiolipin synthase (CMP-forming)
MTFASKITLTRLLLVPVFAVFAIYYARSIENGIGNESLRITALIIFIVAATSDALDGFVARHFNQRSKFGAFIDPIADKTLLLTGIITLSLIDWGDPGWRLPLWFTALVIVRDVVIIGGIKILWLNQLKVRVKPHWTGKVCTVTQMIAAGWVMLRIIPFSPSIPCAIAGFFTLWSGIAYFRQGLQILQQTNVHHPESHP